MHKWVTGAKGEESQEKKADGKGFEQNDSFPIRYVEK